jgi:hypothetical protein
MKKLIDTFKLVFLYIIIMLLLYVVYLLSPSELNLIRQFTYVISFVAGAVIFIRLVMEE